MSGADPRGWMWSEALEMLAKAERLQRQLFHPRPAQRAQPVCWEPPADIFETAGEVVVMEALPGVEPDAVQVTIEGAVLEVFAERVLPEALSHAAIHRMELPRGRFRRQLRLPPGAYDDVRRGMAHGCLILTLRKA